MEAKYGIILLATIAGYSLVNGCSESGIEQCVADYFTTIGADTGHTTPILTEAQLNDACATSFPTFKSCLQPHTSDCPQQAKLAFQGIWDLFDYVCGDGKSDYIRHSPCLQDVDTHSCETTLNNRLRSNPDASLSTRCGYTNDFLSCAYDDTEDECSAEAAEYQKKIVEISLSPLFDSLGCDINAGASVGAFAWMVTGAVVLQWIVKQFY